eukprot:8698852-Alexandrium_andersonii.AAC.1
MQERAETWIAAGAHQAAHAHGGQTPTAIPFQAGSAQEVAVNPFNGPQSAALPPSAWDRLIQEPRRPIQLVQPPRSNPQNFRIGGDSGAPSAPQTYRTDQGVWETPD